eukprot:COSAG06_NODE_29913_length_548_cov_1.258352_2_plen_46_part_01
MVFFIATRIRIARFRARTGTLPRLPLPGVRTTTRLGRGLRAGHLRL